MKTAREIINYCYVHGRTINHDRRVAILKDLDILEAKANSQADLLEACKGLFSVLTKPNDTFHCPDENRCDKESCKDCPIIQPYHKAVKAIAAATA